MLHNGGNGSILVMLDETRLHWKLINFGVLLRSFLGGGGGVRSVSFERDPSLLLFLRMFVRMLEISRIRFLDVVNSSFTTSFSIFLYPPLNYLTQKTEFVHARRGDFRSFDQLPDYRDDSNSFPRSIVINRISIA